MLVNRTDRNGHAAAALLRGVSGVSLIAALLAGSGGLAQTAAGLRAAAGLTTPVVSVPVATIRPVAPNVAGMASASARAIANQAAVTNSVSLAVQANAAARAAAAALTSTVANGLVAGGLVPVANPVLAASDPTGLNTWQGASAPVQTGSAAAPVVTITQTEARALLSWNSFNIGRETSLVFAQQPDWVVLNRIVANIDPATGRLADPANLRPSQILGSITAAGTVLVINPNGILFSATAQVNTHSFLASALEIGARSKAGPTNNVIPTDLADRNTGFLQSGLLLSGELLSSLTLVSGSSVADAPEVEGDVRVAAGASIKAGDGGYVIIAAPNVSNAGQISATAGQVSLQSGRAISAQTSTGASDSVDANVRGLILTSTSDAARTGAADRVTNAATGLIDVPRGYVSLGTTYAGSVTQAGVLTATTSVSRNGKIALTGATVTIAPAAVLAITPDTGTETIPQGADSVAAFKHSVINIGGADVFGSVSPSRIDIGAGALIYAPSANVSIGGDNSISAVDLTPGQLALASSLHVAAGASIDVGGVKDYLVPASRNSIRISPVKRNELRDTPNFREATSDGSFTLNGATLFVDPRLSGVRADGVAWVGSPLIEAGSYYAQIGVGAAELMTSGGNLTLGTRSYIQGNSAVPASVNVDAGATLDISGGWVRYADGVVQTSRLLTADGRIVEIGRADPNDNFVGIVDATTATQPRFGVSTSFGNPAAQEFGFEFGYTEGRDAGSLTIKASTEILNGRIYGDAFAGTQQIAKASTPSVASTISGDLRKLQAAPSELPSGGLLRIAALAQLDTGGSSSFASTTGGADIIVYNGSTPLRPASEILLSDALLSGAGLSAVTLQTSGEVRFNSGTQLTLAAGGALAVDAGRSIRFDGAVDIFGGRIAARTYEIASGSIFRSDDDLPQFLATGAATPRLFDIIVNGRLSVRGRFVNDALASDGVYLGKAFGDGGSISLTVAPRVLIGIGSATAPDYAADLSGSLLINSGALLDVSAGGYVRPDATLALGGRGGNVSLTNETTYFQIAADQFTGSTQNDFITTNFPSFRTTPSFGRNTLAAPLKLEAQVAIAPGTIAGQGFAGGGSFSLVTPDLNFGAVAGASGTAIALAFITDAGFASYNFTTYATRLEANQFSNGIAGNSALLDTESVRIGAGQTLHLTQALIPSLLDAGAIASVRSLASGGDIRALLGSGVPVDGWDQKAVALSFGGLTELDIAAGGRIDGSDGAVLTSAKLRSAGTIRLPGGSVRQALLLPSAYVDSNRPALGVSDLGSVFGARDANGQFDENALNTAGIAASSLPGAALLSNADLASLAGSSRLIYYTANLAADEGVRLLAGSVTDLSGASVRNPRAGSASGEIAAKVTGRIVGGGALTSAASFIGSGTVLFAPPSFGAGRYLDPVSGAVFGVRRPGETFNARAGARIDLRGVSDAYDQEVALGVFSPRAVWSNGGSLTLGAGGTIAGAQVFAAGGAAAAEGGRLTWLDPVLVQRDAAAPANSQGARDVVAADQISAAGFDTFVAQDRLTTSGNVDLALGRGFYLTARPFDGDASNLAQYRAVLASGGALTIRAPYLRLESPQQIVLPRRDAVPGSGSIALIGDTLDIAGAVYVEQSVASTRFDISGDVRLTGVQAPVTTLVATGSPLPVASALSGQLVVNGDLTIRAGQIYPTTGTGSLQAQTNADRSGAAATVAPYLIASTGADATIRFDRATTTTPPAPYAAGGNLLVQAAHIVQGGVLRVPVGQLALGSNSTLALGTSLLAQTVPVTQSVDIISGSLTSVSASGLNIPYGTTTDLIEYFFTPTSDGRLFAPPAASLRFAADVINVTGGATVDASGGGDLYAYEFAAGVGGSRDVLSRTNSDPFSSRNGLQYADGRQVYAIVPGLSASVAPVDPLYSADYAGLYGPGNAGRSVYLEAAPGLAAGWYTLLPARYALLPGGLRVVENTDSAAPAFGINGALRDGSIIVGGHYGISGTAIEESQRRSFTVQSQATFRKFSTIQLTSANTTFANLAARDGLAIPQLPTDAARLVLTPLSELNIGTRFLTAPATGGRGAQVDISATAFDIVATGSSATPVPGTVTLTATDFNNLNAASLLIGGVRTDHADGSTDIVATTATIRLTNSSADPLSAPEIILIADGIDSAITLADGSAIIATGSLADTRTGAYLLNTDAANGVPQQTAISSIVRVANGPERLVARPGATALANSLQQTSLTIGEASLRGTAILLDSSRDLSITDNVLTAATPVIAATWLALGGDDVFFTSSPSGYRGLTITPALEAAFAQSARLTITTKSIIGFDPGTHRFNDLRLDARGLRPFGQAVTPPPAPRDDQFDTAAADPLAPIAVTLVARDLSLDNSDFDRGACVGGTTVNSCGSTGNTLTITAAAVHFGTGAVRTYGFDQRVTLTATQGVFAEGDARFDVGGAALAIDTPYLGDRALVADPRGTKLQPALRLATTGTVALTNRSGVAATSIASAPGASLGIGDIDRPVAAVTIDGTQLRATAGNLAIWATGTIAATGSARLETPGYAKSFGDAADSVTVSAPGGTLSLVSNNGDVDLGAGTLLSIGGGSGEAGLLQLSAAQGLVRLGSIDAHAPGGAASLRFDSGRNPFVSGSSGARLFDLSSFLAGSGAAFTGDIRIRTGEGDLSLAAGSTLRATALRLTADGGAVTIAGTVDTSGVSGGAVALYGTGGVTLAATARLDAHANGYGASDTRSATGGAVELGTSGSGVLTVAAGAVIDVGARQSGARLIATTRKDPVTLNDMLSYNYAAADSGGSVNLRAPLIGSNAVNIAFAGSISGATRVSVEAYRQYDLRSLAGAANCTLAADICINAAGQAVLDLNAAPGQNRLADILPGSIPDFVRAFSLSGATGLGTLTTTTGFVAQPGVELDFAGDIILASNWNLAAGSVNVAAATAAGAIAPSTALGHGLNYVVAGREADVFNRYTDFTYRVGGRPDGAAPVLTLRAGGNLDVRGSITDGFFAFGDPTEPNYISYQLGGGDRKYHPALNVVCGQFASTAFSCGALGTPYITVPGARAVPYAAADIITIAASSLGLGLDLQFDNGAVATSAPYSAAANTPGARGQQAGGVGDPVGAATLFPRLASGAAAASSDIRLVGGAATPGAALLVTADPLATAPVSRGNVSVSGEVNYRAAPIKGTASYAGALQLFNYGFPGNVVLADSIVIDPASFVAAVDGLDGSIYTRFNFGSGSVLSNYFLTTSRAFLAANANAATDYQYFGGTTATPTILTASIDLLSRYFESISVDFGIRVANGSFGIFAPAPRAATTLANPNVYARSLIRTGTGSIDVAAAGDVDLRGGSSVTYRNAAGRPVNPGSASGAQVGGTALYTAGHVVTPGVTQATVTSTGQQRDLDANGLAVVPPAPTDSPPNYQGILANTPVYADGGGAISVRAGRDILGRRDVWSEAFRANVPGVTNAGTASQLWRSGQIGQGDIDVVVASLVNIRVNPQLFSSGIAALGGGSITIDAGRDASELTLAVDTSVTTARVTAPGAVLAATAPLTLVSYGGGDIAVRTGGDLRGGQIDVASGSARISVGGAVASSGNLRQSGVLNQPVAILEPDLLQLRLSDADIILTAVKSVDLAGIAALGVRERTPVNGAGFYSAAAQVDVRSNGAVRLFNRGKDLLTGFSRLVSTTTDVNGALLPGSLGVASLFGAVDLNAGADAALILYPSPTGQLALYAGGDLAGVTLSLDDGDPSLAPGALSAYGLFNPGTRSYGFPVILPNTGDATRRLLHNVRTTHAGDAQPVRIYADGNINQLTLASPKATRIGAGGDITDIIFIGQNLAASDVTRITAGRDISASARVLAVSTGNGATANLPVLQGNEFIIGGPGAVFIEAGRDLGPFLNSATVRSGTQNINYAGGVLTVGNDYNPWLPAAGAKIYASFGVAGGADYAALREIYVNPANVAALDGDLFVQVQDANGNDVPDRAQPIYAPILIDWMTANASAALIAAYGTVKVSAAQAYAVFVQLPALVQRQFLLDKVYFNELAAPSQPSGPSYLQYVRGYRAVNALFAPANGYTANDLSGASNGGTQQATGNLDLRLATLETQRGGDITILGPGGRVLGGSVVATATQAARRGQEVAGNYNLFYGTRQPLFDATAAARIFAIPTGFEGVLSLRGGAVRGFTDDDFLLNQSRLFTLEGGDVTLWSSNGDLNAGQGAKTSANNPPVVVRFDPNAFGTLDQAGSVSGAGIAALQPSDGSTPPNVTLVAPVGTVDAGDAGVRAAGNVFVAAAQVANADNFKVGGSSFGVAGGATVDVGAAASANAASAAAAQAAAAVNPTGANGGDRSRISVDVLGFGGNPADDPCTRVGASRPPNCPAPGR